MRKLSAAPVLGVEEEKRGEEGENERREKGVRKGMRNDGQKRGQTKSSHGDLRGKGLPVVGVGDASVRKKPRARKRVFPETHETPPVFVWQ